MKKASATYTDNRPGPKFNYPKYVIEQAMQKGSCTFVGFVNELTRMQVRNRILKIISEESLPLEIEYRLKSDILKKID